MCMGMMNYREEEQKTEQKVSLLKPLNFENLKAMNIDEMAEFLFSIARCCSLSNLICDGCPLRKAKICNQQESLKHWLESEAE